MIAGSHVYAFGNLESENHIPRYADKCPHGHNGFNCDPPKHEVDIDALEAKERQLRSDVTTLESRIVQLEERLSKVDNVLENRIIILEREH